MEILTKSEAVLRVGEIIERISKGKLFIHPTDTIYGIGCDATNQRAVQKIHEIKERKDAPFSVWVPDKEWIRENCVVTKEAEKWLNELPGPYTLILKLKDKKAVAKGINPRNGSVGVRIPDHWFREVVEHLGVPIVTTSANRTGREFMTSVENLDPEIKKGMNFMIYEGEKKARPSKIVHLEEGEKVEAR